MIDSAETILLGISGGKDSLLMAYLLTEMRNRSPVKFSLEALTIDPGEPSGFTDGELDILRGFLADLGIPYHVVRTKIAKIVEGHPQESACSLCANLRRGAIYKAAGDLGIKKVALAHHLDDAIETFFLNMFYQSGLRCFEPKTFLSRRQITSIRPLIYIPERDIVKAVQALSLPVVATRCPVAGTTRRQEMKETVKELSSRIPAFRNHMRSVLRRVWETQSAAPLAEEDAES
jgi:tRNA(Ile)-lysidine synthase TilS/MesJ